MQFGFSLRHISALAAGLITSAAFAASPTSNLPQELWPAPVVTGAAPSTAAEVRADLILWQRAGMDRFNAGDGVSFDSADYERHLKRYQELRQGPAFQELVQQLKANRS